MYVRLVAGLALCTVLAGSAQTTNSASQTRPLSLRECLELALERNLDLQIQHVAAEIAQFNLNGTYGAYVPTFQFGAQHEFVARPVDFDVNKPNPFFPYELETERFQTALKGRVPLGLSYDLSAITDQRDAKTDFRSNPDVAADFPPSGIRHTNNYLAEAGLSLQQHLLKDFWIDQYRELLLVRRKELHMSRQQLRFQVMRTALAVELAYYDLIRTREQLRVEQKALELREQFLAETRRRVQVGDLPPLDSEQAETQLQNSLTVSSLAREAAESQQNVLKSLLTDNFVEWADLEVEPTDVLLAVPAEANRSESFLSALKNRPDLIEARLAVERSDVTVRFRKNQLFPTLDLVGRYGGLGIQPDWDSAANDAANFRSPAYYYGVVVSFPLSNLSERNQYRASKAAKQLAQLQLQKAEQEVLVQVTDWLNRVQSRFTQVGSTRKARAYAEAALAAEQKKLQNGLSTSFFVLQLQETLTAARTAEIQALADYNIALAQLAFAEGKTLERHGLQVD